MNQSHPAAPRELAAEAFAAYGSGAGGPILQWFEGHRPHDLFARFTITFERLGDVSGRRGLDIGCGAGHFVAEALDRGADHVVAIDPAPGMLELVAQRLAHRGTLDRATLVEGSFPAIAPAGPFDFAIAVGVLDYVADPLAFLAGLRGLMHGVAIASFPSKHWFRAPLRKFRHRLRNCPVYFYDEPQIHRLARQAGFADAQVIQLDGVAADFHVRLIV